MAKVFKSRPLSYVRSESAYGAANVRERLLLVLLSLALCTAAGAPRRIVSLSPNVTELLYGIGAFSQVVGVSDYCTYPPEVSKLPSVGGWSNPSLEKLAALGPDLVIVDDAEGPFVEDSFRKLGLKFMLAPTRTVEDVYRAMAQLGQATGHEQQAARLIAATRDGLARVTQKTAGLTRPKVVLIVDRTPGTLRDLYTATAGGFLGDLIEIAGGRIAVPPGKNGYGALSKEDLLAANPDMILDFTHEPKSRFSSDPMEAWRELPELKAVRTGRVYGVNEDFVPHASQRMVQTAELFARLIHPEVK
jgi:iron complex transport system substrate-binding protein